MFLRNFPRWMFSISFSWKVLEFIQRILTTRIKHFWIINHRCFTRSQDSSAKKFKPADKKQQGGKFTKDENSGFKKREPYKNVFQKDAKFSKEGKFQKTTQNPDKFKTGKSNGKLYNKSSGKPLEKKKPAEKPAVPLKKKDLKKERRQKKLGGEYDVHSNMKKIWETLRRYFQIQPSFLFYDLTKTVIFKIRHDRCGKKKALHFTFWQCFWQDKSNGLRPRHVSRHWVSCPVRQRTPSDRCLRRAEGEFSWVVQVEIRKVHDQEALTLLQHWAEGVRDQGVHGKDC